MSRGQNTKNREQKNKDESRTRLILISLIGQANTERFRGKDSFSDRRMGWERSTKNREQKTKIRGGKNGILASLIGQANPERTEGGKKTRRRIEECFPPVPAF